MMSIGVLSLAIHASVLLALPPREPVRSLDVQGRYLAINGRPTFLVGQMDAMFRTDRPFEDVTRIVDTMMVPYGMNVVVGDLGIINWTAFNNVQNVRLKMEKVIFTFQYPWMRPGPGETKFGGPRFDLNQFDPGFFERLVRDVDMLNARGIVPVVEIFSDHGINMPLHWWGHPFHPDNNINDVGLPVKNAIPGYFENPKALACQEAYVRKLLDTLKGRFYILSPFGEARAAPPSYINRWLRLFDEHEKASGQKLFVCISGEKALLDQFAPDPAVDLVDMYCYNGGNYDGADVNVPDGPLGLRATLKEVWDKYHKPVGKLYFKYGYPYTMDSAFGDQKTRTEAGGPPTAARDAMRVMYEGGGFGIFFKMAWLRDRGEYMKPDQWSQDIREFQESIAGRAPATSTQP